MGAVALALAACGSSSSSSSSSTAPSTTSSTGSPTSTTSASPTTTGGSTTTTGIPACRTAALSIALGAPNGSAGATHYGLTFHNTGTAACTLYGFPGVSFLDTGGHQIGAPAQRPSGTALTTVTLMVGGDAFSSVAVTDPGIPPCSGSTAAAQVRVYPPGETRSTTIPAPSGLQVCSSPNTAAYLSSIVTPVSAVGI